MTKEPKPRRRTKTPPELDDVLRVGGLMRNLVGQGWSSSENDLDAMRTLQRQWDEAVRKLKVK
jgi:hypothetical protein